MVQLCFLAEPWPFQQRYLAEPLKVPNLKPWIWRRIILPNPGLRSSFVVAHISMTVRIFQSPLKCPLVSGRVPPPSSVRCVLTPPFPGFQASANTVRSEISTDREKCSRTHYFLGTDTDLEALSELLSVLCWCCSACGALITLHKYRYRMWWWLELSSSEIQIQIPWKP